jgi:hypothetical protein
MRTGLYAIKSSAINDENMSQKLDSSPLTFCIGMCTDVVID